MFKIKNIEINNNVISITDKDNKCYYANIEDSNIKKLLPIASSRSAKIKKNIRYFEKLFIICMIGIVFCTFEVLKPILLGKSYAEVLVLYFGGLDMACISLSIANKMCMKWLKKYTISNEYWEKILETMKDNQYKQDNENQKTNQHVKEIENFLYQYRKKHELDNSFNEVKENNNNKVYTYKR